MPTDSSDVLDEIDAFDIVDAQNAEPPASQTACSCLTSACFACNLTD